MRRLNSRIRQLQHEISQIAELKQFDRRIKVSGVDELGQLERSVNHIIGAIDKIDERDDDGNGREELFKILAENQQETVILHRQNEIIYANWRAAELRGVRQEDLAETTILDLVHPSYRHQAQQIFMQRLAGEDVPELYEIKMLNSSGNGVWVEVAESVIEYEQEPAIISAMRDISVRRSLQQKTVAAKDRAEATLASISDGILTTNFAGLIDFANDAALKMIGKDLDEITGKTLTSIVSLIDETDRQPFADPVEMALTENRSVSLGRKAMMISAEGIEHLVEVTVNPLSPAQSQNPSETHINARSGCVVVLHDVTELRGLARQMTYHASHDALTGLANRREFERKLDELIESSREESLNHVICYMDLDRFKAVNDTSGHAAGDNMLRQLAILIKEKVRDSDIVARLGGDEFGMLLVGCPLDKARQIADDVCAAVHDYRFLWRDKVFNVGVSIGLVEISHESGAVDEVISAADSACYVAKQQGRSRVHVYSAKDEAVARHKGEIAWLQLLQQAIKTRGFVLYSQSICAMDSRQRGGPSTEILLRLRDTTGAVAGPEHFMESAQRYHLMPAIDRWVVKNTLAAIANGSLPLALHGRCSINISGQTLSDGQFLEYVVECFDETGVKPEVLCFEVTENSVITNMSQAQRFIAVLHSMGCEFALDDFGTGLGSFSNLKNLKMDYLKIDGEFCHNIADDKVNQAMVTAIVKLARSLNIKVIAEEVAQKDDLDVLRFIGVDFAQGHYLSEPNPI